MSGPTDAAGRSESLADVIERLFAEFEAELSLPTIVAVVRRCRRELDIVSGPALPELLERLARERLSALVAADRAEARASPGSVTVPA